LVRALPGIILHPDSVTLPTSLTCTGEQAATARKPSTQTNDSAPATAAPEPIPEPVTQLLKEQARICDRSAVLAETDDEETFSQSLGKAWKSFTDDYLSPLTDPLLGALGFLAAGVVAALLLVWPLGRLTTWWYVTRSSVAPKGRIPAYVTDRLAATWAGGALLVLTALLVLRWPEGQLLPLYTLLVGVGAVLLGWGLS